jgi:hypothetical protein
MRRFWGTTDLTNLWPGAVYFNTASNTFWVGNVSSNPVLVGNAAWTNAADFAAASTAIISTSTNLTLGAGAYLVFVSGTPTITLPDATTCTGRTYRVKNIGNGTAIMSGTIDGKTGWLIDAGNAFDFVSDGAWRVQ